MTLPVDGAVLVSIKTKTQTKPNYFIILNYIMNFFVPLLDSPRVLVPYMPPKGNLRFDFHVSCPLSGNPSLECSWTFFECGKGERIITDPITFSNNGNNINCTLNGEHLTATFSDTCFQCNASNALGSNSVMLPPINFSGNFFHV